MNIKKLLLANWPIITILSASLALRIWRLDELVTIGGDQGYDLIKIKEILDGNLTLLGSPIGHLDDTVLYLGPLYYYLVAPFLIITRLDPLGLAIPIIIARLTTILFVFLVAQKLANRKVAIVAAILSALSPYFVNSLGPTSQPYLIPALVAVIIFLMISKAFLRINKKTFWTLATVGFASGLMTSLHYLGLSVFLALVLFVFYSERSEGKENHGFLAVGIYGLGAQKLKSLISLFLGFLLALSPLLLFELRNSFFLSKQLIAQLSKGTINTEPLLVGNQLTDSFNFLSKDIIGFSLPFSVFLGILIISVAIALLESKNTTRPLVIFLVSVMVINLAAVGLWRQKVQPHYLAAVYPSLFIFVSLAISSLARFIKILPVILTIVIASALLIGNDLNRASGYTMPEDLTLRQIRQISKIIAQDAQGQFNIVSTLDGDSRALPYRYLVALYGKEALGVEYYDRGDSLYVITRDPPSTVRDNSLFEIASFQPSNVVSHTNIIGDIKLIKLSKTQKQPEEVQKFITIINPVRSRDLWQDRDILHLSRQLNSIDKRGLPSSWLLAYDTLDDVEVTGVFKNTSAPIEVGALLEVSEKWATDSRVSYKIGEGDYYRPDKVFLSGYSPQEREKLIKTYFEKFQLEFGTKPQVAGAWYVDARTQSILAKVGIKGLLVVADQYDTDALASWGKYWSMPFYPSKYNSLEPAANQSLKIPIVNLEWAQRHPTLGYGRTISDSRQSFQANDYINNGFDSSYFDQMLALYLSQAKTDFVQITLGLEAGQEAVSFGEEFENQLDRVAALANQNQLKVVTMGQFSDWYRQTYPGISPSHFLTAQDSFWYMSPKFRARVVRGDQNYFLLDLRYYDQKPTRDYFWPARDKFLAGYVPAAIDDLDLGNSLNLGDLRNLDVHENFDRLTLKADNILVRIDTKGVLVGDAYQVSHKGQIFSPESKFLSVLLLEKVKSALLSVTGAIRFSKIEGEPVFGLKISDTKLIGIKGVKIGAYDFPFQSLIKFKSPAQVLDIYIRSQNTMDY